MDKLYKGLKSESLLIPFVAIIVGLLLGAIIMLIGGYDPVLAYQSLVTKIFGSSYDIGEAIRTIIPLVMSGLAVGIAFRSGLFNIGVDGQIVMGALGALIIGTQLNLPPFLHATLSVLFGALLGGLWGALIGYIKAKRGINEVITSIMFNFIALYISQFFIRLFMAQEGTQRSEMIKESASIQISWLSQLMGGARMHWGFVLMIAAVIFYSVYLNKTKWGYELRAVGQSQHAAFYAGMKVPNVVVRAMFISGVFGGLIGTFEVLGVFKYVAISSTTSGIGFDGIAVAILGGNTALGVLLSGILVGALTYGSQGMSFGANVPGEIIRMVIGFIIFFVAAPGIVKTFFPSVKKKSKKEA
ncbi:ABC transporter permease [Bacillus sp. DTU_2020_1000418_1_SI_GHA_SEK_038]|uniref:ABC transporter permease n=1 Tax=Bacillus sp. DTU_2020_1000418_1_SI_GHA_SEK_038 TaxID=3077585 RepID=UPI0028E38C69|nr:ABC transporter permease [Bacillus sp. DTU_2020_1000418_1_SI_GHA_SEK_038]WNS75370.1 ABC transporter permease [Bacillus sp. DTU_2020_1000418_1_SI_GHA_SEK_038]